MTRNDLILALVKEAKPTRRQVFLYEPTEKQKDAGNYPKLHLTFHGFRVSIENPAGSYRRGVDKDGNEWSTKMTADYGYICGTEGAD